MTGLYWYCTLSKRCILYQVRLQWNNDRGRGVCRRCRLSDIGRRRRRRRSLLQSSTSWMMSRNMGGNVRMNFHLLPKNGMEDGYNSVCFKKEPTGDYYYYYYYEGTDKPLLNNAYCVHRPS